MNTVNVVGVAYDCRIQITIGKICPTSTGVRDNVVIVPLANSRKRKTRCGFSSLFRSLASISFNLLSACFFFFFFLIFFILFKRKQRSFHQFHLSDPIIFSECLRIFDCRGNIYFDERVLILFAPSDICDFIAYGIIVSPFFFSFSLRKIEISMEIIGTQGRRSSIFIK